jgi:hypothetical protein
MTYVTSRGFPLPESADEMSQLWFNLWRPRLWPYNELRPGDELWWYESPTKRLRWRTRVINVEAFPYVSLKRALSHLDSAFGVTIDRRQGYLRGKPNEGYCLGYSVEALESVDIARPHDVKFNQNGWERAERDVIAKWLEQARA